MKCAKCGAAAKPLFTGSYCTADCDKPKAIPVTTAVTFPEKLYSWGSKATAYTEAGLALYKDRGGSISYKVEEVFPTTTMRESEDSRFVACFVDNQPFVPKIHFGVFVP